MDYLSDDELQTLDEEVEPTFDELYPEEELDEETRNIIFKNIKNKDDLYIAPIVSKSNVKAKEKKTKTKTSLSLKELHEKITESQPKKWTSSKATAKTQLINKIEKRHFNPRLPPFRSLTRVKIADVADFKDTNIFPSLGK